MTQGRDENEAPEGRQSSCEQRHISCWGQREFSGVEVAIDIKTKTRVCEDKVKVFLFNFSGAHSHTQRLTISTNTLYKESVIKALVYNGF